MEKTDPDPSSAPRTPVCWQALHDNGWTTIIEQRPDRSFAAWAMTQHDRSAIYVDADIDRACAAVMASLYRKTGHRACTDGCVDWWLHQH